LAGAADWHLFAGDESAIPAFAELIAALPGDCAATAIVEIAEEGEEQPLPGASVCWVPRDGAAPGAANLLDAAVAAATLPSGRGAAYLFGESRAMVTLRAAVQSRGIAHEETVVKGYWNLGRVQR
jgi:NADPH-dependent ferric siderophore reductase